MIPNGYRIIIEDTDRDQEPERPWTAGAYDPDGVLYNVGFGATPAEALENLTIETIWED